MGDKSPKAKNKDKKQVETAKGNKHAAAAAKAGAMRVQTPPKTK
jgi:hypothetical protein